MELKGKHIYGLGAAVIGAVALVFALLYWFVNRTLDTNVQVGFALGLVGLAVFAWLEIDWLTRVLKTRQVRYGAETFALVVLFLILVGLVNWIFTRDRLALTPQFAIPLQGRLDLTQDQQHTLAPETVKLLTELDETVKVLAFYSPTSFGREDAETLLKNYKDKSGGKVEYEFVDPFTKPGMVEEYGVTRDGTMVVLRGERREQVEFSNESALSNAIVKLNDATIQVVYFISGHGELSVDDAGQDGLSQVKTLLEGVNYQVKSLNAISETVPPDASAIVIAGPGQQYNDREVKAIDTYLAGGGKAIVLYEPSVQTGLEAGQDDLLVQYLKDTWGLTLNDDFIVDPSNFYQSAQFPVTINYGTTPVSQGLEGVNALFWLARSVTPAGPGAGPEGIATAAIVSTMGSSWGETNVAALTDPEQSVDQGEQEPSGALVIGATAENSSSGARVVVFGDSDFGKNQYWQGLSNGYLLLNSIKWVTAREDQIAITPRDTTERTLNIVGNRDVAIVFLLSCLLPPLLVLIGGVSVWWSRRSG